MVLSTRSRPLAGRLGPPPLCRPSLLTLLFNGLLVLWLLARPGRQSVGVIDISAVVGPALGSLIAWHGQRWPWSRPSASTQRLGAAPIFLGLAAFSLAMGQAIWAYYELVLHQITPFPSWADVGFLGAAPFILLGILTLPRRPLSAVARTRILFDGLMLMTAAVTFSWYFVLGPTVLHSSESLFATLVSSAYPVADLLLLLCLLLLAAQADEPRLAPVLRILGVGLSIIVVTDSVYSYQLVQGTYTPGQLLVVGWPLGYMLVGLGARTVRVIAANAAPAPAAHGALRTLWRLLLPYALVPAVAVLLAVVWVGHGVAPLKTGVLMGSLVLLALVLLRQVLALLENRQLYRRLDVAYQATLAAQEALRANNRALAAANAHLQALSTTDPLTNLPNHRTLHRAVDLELERARRYSRPCSLLVLDVDHFKAFNDTYGHPAGDAALREFSQVVRRTLRGIDIVGRWGGEEFLAVLPETDVPLALETAERVRDAVAGHTFPAGGGGHVTCSIGVATYPSDGADRDELVAAADRALYVAKRLGRNQVRAAADPAVPMLSVADQPATSREESALLGTVEALAALVEARDHYTGQHTHAVALLTLRLALALGLDAAQARMVSLAGRLHDVGKVAIPDAVLQKAGRLSAEEWALMRTHPVVGAELVGHVPALRGAASLIRAHHEHWDGAGYPAGLAGEAIPLGARIIAVAEAYEAMTSERPYRPAGPATWALAELRRCAGTQFDPTVVTALEQVLAADRGPLVSVPGDAVTAV
jgi:diguanylate cyclase (GGDEF)-like protein